MVKEYLCNKVLVFSLDFLSDSGSNIYAQIKNSGNFLIGNPPDNGYKLQVNGTTKTQGLDKPNVILMEQFNECVKITFVMAGATIVKCNKPLSEFVSRIYFPNGTYAGVTKSINSTDPGWGGCYHNSSIEICHLSRITPQFYMTVYATDGQCPSTAQGLPNKNDCQMASNPKCCLNCSGNCQHNCKQTKLSGYGNNTVINFQLLQKWDMNKGNQAIYTSCVDPKNCFSTSGFDESCCYGNCCTCGAKNCTFFSPNGCTTQCGPNFMNYENFYF